MEVTGRETLGSVLRCLQAIPLDCCSLIGAASQKIGIEVGNRWKGKTETERSICRDSYRETERFRGKERHIRKRQTQKDKAG